MGKQSIKILLGLNPVKEEFKTQLIQTSSLKIMLILLNINRSLTTHTYTTTFFPFHSMTHRTGNANQAVFPLR